MKRNSSTTAVDMKAIQKLMGCCCGSENGTRLFVGSIFRASLYSSVLNFFRDYANKLICLLGEERERDVHYRTSESSVPHHRRRNHPRYLPKSPSLILIPCKVCVSLVLKMNNIVAQAFV